MNTQTENLMTEEEMKQFFFDLMMTAHYDLFTMDGLTFFLHTLSKLAETDRVKVQDVCNDISRYVFTQSIAFDKAHRTFEDSIHQRYRNTDYRKSNNELYDELQFAAAETSANGVSGIAETPNDTAKQIADLLNNPKLPTRLSDAIQEGLTEFYNCDLDSAKLQDDLKSPEYIARLLSMAKK